MLTPIEYAYYITGTLVAVGGVAVGISKIYKFVNRLAEAVGADKKGRTVVERLERVEHQLWENGGSSLADRVNVLALESKENIAETRFIKKILLANYKVDFDDDGVQDTGEVTVVETPKPKRTRKKL
jgi:hypothetical protein